MNLSYFISSRLGKDGKGSFSKVVSVIAIVSIALALIILIGSFLILGAFKHNIRDKVYSFDAHIQMYRYVADKYGSSEHQENQPISTTFGLYQNPSLVEGIEHIQVFANKVGMILKDENVFAVVMKGIGTDYKSESFAPYIQSGKYIDVSGEDPSNVIMISDYLAKKLHFAIGDTVRMSFLRFSPKQTKPVHKRRSFRIGAIFKTDVPEIDESKLFCDIRQIRKINNWKEDEVGGFELYVNNHQLIDTIADKVWYYGSYMEKQNLETKTIHENYEEIFVWLEMLNTNVKILIVIVFMIACFNVFSTLYILVMERTSFIGILKAIGASDVQIAKIFWVKGLRLLVRGVLIGNGVALGLCALQYFMHIIPLDPENYYMSYVPIEWNWPAVIALNLFVIAFVNVVLLIPLIFIISVQIVRSIRFS